MAMSRFADLVVAVDGSEPSDRAVSFALALAARAGATLCFSSVVAREGEQRAKLACVQATARAVAHGIEARASALGGPPAESIVSHALAVHASGIVVGTRAHSAERAAALGSVAAAVVRLSAVPVFTVGAETTVRDGRSIVVAVDETPAAEAALDAALELALERHATLHLVHVVQERGALADEERAFAAMVERVRAAGVAYSAELREGDPVEELVDAAERRAAALIATGTHGHNAVARLILGSVAEGLMRAAPVPVMTVRA
jgi:nucleotide-binding universal stress UspA family protein